MKIKKIEPHKNKYLVHVNHDVYEASLFLMTTHKINLETEYTLDEVLQFIEAAKYEYYEDLLSKKLAKPLTEHEVKTFLLEKNAPYNIIYPLIEKFKKYQFINDYHYIIKYIEMNKQKFGKLMMEKKLLEKGIHETLLASILKNHYESEYASTIVKKKMSTVKNKTKEQVRRTVYQHLVSKGFDESLSETLVNQYLYLANTNDEHLLKKQYEKLFKKYDSTQKLVDALLKKGFKYHDIMALITEEGA